MTPEEKAVIQAAIKQSRTLGGLFDQSPLGKAVSALMYSCPQCNYDRHICPGDGNPIGHGDTDCGEHDDAEREHLRVQLQEIGQGTLQEWMRIVDIEDVAGIQSEARVSWQDHQGACVVGEAPYGEEYGCFRLMVHAEDLGPVSPIGPENDLGVYGMDGSEEDIRLRTQQAEDGCRPEPDELIWVARTMTDVRPGDTVRPLGTDIAGMRVTARCWPAAAGPDKQTARDRGSWHVIEGGEGHWSNHVIQPGECCVHLDGAGHRLFKPTFGVEIQLTASEVAAIELLGWDNRERLLTSE